MTMCVRMVDGLWLLQVSSEQVKQWLMVADGSANVYAEKVARLERKVKKMDRVGHLWFGSDSCAECGVPRWQGQRHVSCVG